MHFRLRRGLCRILGHRWDWRVSNDWPYLECTRCSSGWMVGRPAPPIATTIDRHLSDRDGDYRKEERHNVRRLLSRAV
jgi:hypothetical protein